ncbi:MAG: class I SAM-dependent methyltransferase [Thermodesulfobacteriota bacterium]|nr:class I SAM-dependent methyltransferase [Thermodesulfobacteriota bacterium]
MKNKEPLEGYIRIPSSLQDLDISVKESEVSRKVSIKGEHVMPGGSYHCPFSELETRLSLDTLKKIAMRKGRHFRDEIERSEDPNYMQRKLNILLREFRIDLSKKRMLDFGCGSGASTLNFLRCGATDITGVDVDETLLDIAKSRVNDFFQCGYQFVKIEYIDGAYSMPFSDGEFDIVWAQAIMEHVLTDQRKFVLRELWRVLKRGGLFIIFGTPNRLWIKEYHTSNLYFVNYLPLNMAISIAHRYSRRIPMEISREELLFHGFRGCTYWEIKRALPGAICLNNVFRRKDLSVGIQSWKGDSGSTLRKRMIDLYGFLMELVDPIFALFHLPQTAFLPSHIIVFKK